MTSRQHGTSLPHHMGRVQLMHLMALEEDCLSVKSIAFFQDGAASQFKQRFLFHNITYFEEVYDIKTTWNFFAQHMRRVQLMHLMALEEDCLSVKSIPFFQDGAASHRGSCFTTLHTLRKSMASSQNGTSLPRLMARD